MKIYGVLNGSFVENVAVAESLLLIQALIPSKRIVEETEESGIVWIGSELIGSKFKPPRIFESWLFDMEAFKWVAPKSKPRNKKDYYWSEADLDWVVVPILPAPEPDEATKK
jgi:hypothetical protein